MSTFLEMQQRIADDLDRSDLTTQIKKAINRAIKYYESVRFYFQETTGTFTTVANQNSYGTADGLPSTIKEIDYLQITISSNNKYGLKQKPYQFLTDLDFGSFKGQPSFYAWYQSKIYLYPTPNSTWTVTASFKKSYAELSADSDTNDWTTEAEDLIEARATWWIYKRVIKSKEDADEAKEDEMQALNCLIAKTEQLINSGSLTGTHF